MKNIIKINTNNSKYYQLRLIKDRYPEDLVNCIEPFICSKCSDDRYTVSHGGYTTILPTAIVIDDITSFENIIRKLANKFDIKLVDLVSMEYSLYALNDDKNNIKSLLKDDKIFSNLTCLYGFIIDIKIGDNLYSINLLNSLQETRTHIPKYDIPAYMIEIANKLFDSDKAYHNNLLIEEFVKYCRGKN